MGNLWFRSSGENYQKDDLEFYNPEDYEWAVELENNWNRIKPEVTALIQRKDKEFTSNAYSKLTGKGNWSSLSYMFWGLKTQKGFKKECPILNSYIEKIPGLVALSFSCLAAQTDLNEHFGLTNAMFRCHYGIEVPSGLPECGIKVNGKERGWEEGKWFFFIDAFLHSAWNHTDKRRIVMIIDVIRPEFLAMKSRICISARARHTQIKVLKKYSSINKLPRFMKEFLYTGIYLLILTMNPVHAFMDKE